ncbi:hypothetical protein HQ865_05515 [Mucilaginibacter mali]|uniref:histidine kinase n=1 Tax=Mucilaginibacter mali TaxID=2740462 RepID=A0A7D4TL64_9SPHI|nr:ATP-binding protein [Mucilaginibacter mali]QKJ29233.1 hypothetical protein HQ865_05515 [Mucilaginibacter mali]
MFWLTVKRTRTKPLINSLLWLCVLPTLIFSSCDQRSDGVAELSKEFKPIYDSTDRLFSANRFDEAVHYLDSASQGITLSPIDRHRKAAFHYNHFNKIKHDYEKALLYADTMVITANQLTNKQQYIAFLGDANFARGDALFNLGRYNESYNSYYQGYLLGKTNLDNCTLSAYTYRMGMITYKQGNYKYAATYFKESFDLNKSCKTEFVSFFRQQEVLDNIALSYRNSGKLDSALFFYSKALKYIDDNEPSYKDRIDILNVARAVIYGNKADVLTSQGKNEEAAELLKKSIATNLKKGNDNIDAELSEVKLGQIYLAQNRYELVLPLMISLRKQLDSAKSSDAEAGYNLVMGTYYRKKNDAVNAMPFLENFHHIKDSLSARNRILKESNVNEQLANLEKQYQITDLRNRQRVYMYTGVIFFCMTTIIVLLIYRNWKRSGKEMATVSALNKQVILQKADLENTLADLQTSSQEKDRILRTVAHDLRNPLGGIASLTSVMVSDADYTSEQLELLKIIKETAFDSLELINEILEATNSGGAELQKQPVDINTLLSNSVELLRFKAAEKNQKIMLNTLDAPEELLISREKIWRVISNLISNAIKFSPVGSDIRVSITDQEHDVQISVNDHGIGIPDNIKNTIFNMFTEAKRPGTLGEKSFGLGLSICRQIIEKHHGKIWFESSTENGTTFYVRLAKAQMPEATKA